MMTKSLGFFLAVSLAFNAFLLVTMEFPPSRSTWVTPSAPPAPCPISEGDHHLYQALGLSTDQLAKVQPLARTFHDRLQALQKDMEAEKSLLVHLLAKEDVNHAQMEKLRKAMASIQDEIQKEIISHILELRGILTAQQKERFFALVSQNMAANP
jgi:Spy/CpxP family protein refolding chaperone